MSAEAKGFEKATSGKFKVDINENATTNLSLKVAGASQTVQVEAEARLSKPKMRKPVRSSIASSSTICR